MRFSHTLLADPLVERDVVGSIGLACSTLGGGSHSRGGGMAGGQVRGYDRVWNAWFSIVWRSTM